MALRFLAGLTQTRKEELLQQLRAIWTHDSIVIPLERREDYINGIRDYERDPANAAAFRALISDSWQTTLKLVSDAVKCS